MTTRAQLRTSLRTRLEDTSGSPLWDDTALNEALTQAVRTYGTRVPREAVANVSVVAGTSSYAIPADARERDLIRLYDDKGSQIPTQGSARSGTGPASTSDEQAWWMFADLLRLAVNPSANATWSLHYLATRELVADDVTAQPIEPSHEPIVLALASAWCWERRESEDAKRGRENRDAARQRQHAESEAERMFRALNRRARGGRLA